MVSGMADYLQTILDGYPNKSSFRNTVYLLEGVLISLFVYLWVEYTQTGRLFRSFYPVIVASIVILSQYLVIEIGARFFYKHVRPFKATIGKFWLISFAGVVFGYLMFFLMLSAPVSPCIILKFHNSTPSPPHPRRTGWRYSTKLFSCRGRCLLFY